MKKYSFDLYVNKKNKALYAIVQSLMM